MLEAFSPGTSLQYRGLKNLNRVLGWRRLSIDNYINRNPPPLKKKTSSNYPGHCITLIHLLRGRHILWGLVSRVSAFRPSF